MEKRLDRIQNKLDSVDSKLGSIDTHMAVYNEELKEHIRRTELLENEVRPIKVHVLQVKGAFKLLTVLSIISTVVIAVIQVLK